MIGQATAGHADQPTERLVRDAVPGPLIGRSDKSFLHDILEAAGGTNVFASMATESVQASSEQILTRAPDVIVEVRSTGTVTAAEQQEAVTSWSVLGSLPAVRNHRVIVLGGQGLVVPGPRIADSAEALARALHP